MLEIFYFVNKRRYEFGKKSIKMANSEKGGNWEAILKFDPKKNEKCNKKWNDGDKFSTFSGGCTIL